MKGSQGKVVEYVKEGKEKGKQEELYRERKRERRKGGITECRGGKRIKQQLI